MGFEIINLLKKEKGWKNEDLAKISGVPKSTIDKITAGTTTNPNFDTVQALAYALGCSVDDFRDLPDNNQLTHLTHQEKEHIKKYRALDESGKETVDFILDKEYARAMDSQHVQEMVNQASSFEDQNNTIRLSNIKHTGKTQTVRIASRNGPSTLTLNEEQLKAARELVKKLQENPDDDIDDDLV